jgi:hypothetical protein
MVTVQTSRFTFAPVKTSLQALALKGFDLLTLLLTGTRISSLQNQKSTLQAELTYQDYKSTMNNIALEERQEELLFYKNKAILLKAKLKKQNEALEECKQALKKAVDFQGDLHFNYHVDK